MHLQEPVSTLQARSTCAHHALACARAHPQRPAHAANRAGVWRQIIACETRAMLPPGLGLQLLHRRRMCWRGPDSSSCRLQSRLHRPGVFCLRGGVSCERISAQTNVPTDALTYLRNQVLQVHRRVQTVQRWSGREDPQSTPVRGVSRTVDRSEPLLVRVARVCRRTCAQTRTAHTCTHARVHARMQTGLLGVHPDEQRHIKLQRRVASRPQRLCF